MRDLTAVEVAAVTVVQLFKRLRRRRPLQLKCKVCGGVLG
jgi:hypothetical protein